MTKGPKSRSGPVSLPRLSKGIESVIANAESILGDSNVLFRQGRYSRAFSLAISAIEEAGKVSVLYNMASLDPGSQPQWKLAWRNFRDHKHKSTVGLVQSVIALSGAQGDPAVAFAMSQRQHAGLVEQLRQTGLYVDYDFDASKWVLPSGISRDLAQGAVAVAQAAVQRVVALRDLGLYRGKPLALRAQMYAVIQSDLDDGRVTPANFRAFMARAKAIHKVFFSKLKKLGIDIPEDEVSL